MKLKVRHRVNTQFSMSSMTDIVFLLLIFFMLTVSFVTPTGLVVDLPASHSANTLSPQIQITITSKLDYYIDNEPVKLEDLGSILQEKISQKSNLILLQVDRSIPVQHMIQVIDIANSLHAQVSVATRPD
ncbi:Biopolymer transport protein ExbD/TolR [Candidatus Amoebophilus asiaticus 5a2]|uniref:Biopolymer transport protein ExbD/TolR n=1 Tax=Amoebophilus asiaticus (strain 5a2) TaxID=452471 RepID=B3EU88_AMOA5|nr:Biopolymer transport protein ExbD/TolR [Candidatus Amoebophilus asiaticus 5a2]